MGSAESDAANALQRLRYFAHFSDADGLIAAAAELEAAAPLLLHEDVLLKEHAPRQLIKLLANPRADAQIAACRALTACCRFPAFQLEFVAEQGVPLLVGLLSRTEVQPMVAVAASLTSLALANHPEAQQALMEAGALRRLMALARDELHPAQDEAAAALAQVGGHKAAAEAINDKRGVGGPDAAESFVVMASGGGSVSREQACLGMRQLCGTSRNRMQLADAGAVSALLCCCDFWQPEVARAASLALASLCEEPAAARQLPPAIVPIQGELVAAAKGGARAPAPHAGSPHCTRTIPAAWHFLTTARVFRRERSPGPCALTPHHPLSTALSLPPSRLSLPLPLPLPPSLFCSLDCRDTARDTQARAPASSASPSSCAAATPRRASPRCAPSRASARSAPTPPPSACLARCPS